MKTRFPAKILPCFLDVEEAEVEPVSSVNGNKRRKRKRRKERVVTPLGGWDLSGVLIEGEGESEHHGDCYITAFCARHIKNIDKETERNRIVLEGKLSCGHICSATLGAIIKQPHSYVRESDEPPVFFSC